MMLFNAMPTLIRANQHVLQIETTFWNEGSEGTAKDD